MTRKKTSRRKEIDLEQPEPYQMEMRGFEPHRTQGTVRRRTDEEEVPAARPRRRLTYHSDRAREDLWGGGWQAVLMTRKRKKIWVTVRPETPPAETFDEAVKKAEKRLAEDE